MSLNFEKYTAKGNEFIKTLAHELGDENDRNYASRVLRAVFQALRNRIPPDESLQLTAQLPMYIKAVYIDGWNIKYNTPGKIHSVQAFIEDVRKDGRR